MCVPPQMLYKSSENAEKTKEFRQIEKNKLDAKVTEFIEKTFGSESRKTLVRVSEDVGDITCVPVVVFPDDTVKDLHDKIHLALGSSPKENKTSLTPIYAWCTTHSLDEKVIKDVVIDRFYAHSDLPKTWGNLLAALQQSVPTFKINAKETEIDVNRLFDKSRARQMLESHVRVREGMLQNLNFQCNNEDGQSLIFPVDPFSEKASSPFFNLRDESDFITVVPHLQRPLESFAPQENIIQFCLKKDVSSMYFPRDVTMLGMDEGSLKKTRERMELMSDLRVDIDGNHTHFDTQTSFYKVNYHRHQKNFVSNVFTIPLAFLFQNFPLQSDLVPFMSFKSRTGTLYKLDKNALAPRGRIMQRNLDLWTMFGQKNGENITTGQKEALIFKIDTKTSFATLILYENGELDVRAYFSLHDQLSFDQLENLLLHPVNQVIEKINVFLQNMSYDTIAQRDIIITPLHKQEIHGSMILENKPRLNAHCWFYRKNIKTPKVNMKQLVNIFHQLSPYFVVIQKESAKKEDVIHLAYKRTDDFYSLQNMYAFIHRFLKSGAREGQEKTQVQLLANVFDLPTSKAKKVLRMAKEDTGLSTVTDFRQPFQYLHIQIYPISRGFRVFLEDITRVRYFDRVMNILQIAFANAFQNIPDSANNIKKQPLTITGYEEGSRTPPREDDDLGSDHFSLSDGGDLLGDFNLDLDDADALFLEEMRQESKANTSPLKESGPSASRMSSVSDGDPGSVHAISPNTIFNEDVHEVYQGMRAYQDKKEAPAREYVTDNILRNLQKADPELFQKNNYSTDCQMVLTSSARQPVVVRPEELQKIQRKYPGSVPNYIAYGSSREAAKDNVYFCPDVWCAQSRVAMTRAQFEDNKGKCPDPDEPPIAYYKSKYYNDPKSDTNKRGYVSFLKKDESTSFCLPCCGKKIPKERNKDIKKCNVSIVDRNTQKKDKKKIVSSDRHSNTDEEEVHDIIIQMREDAKQIEKEKYILKDFPLPARRLGYIPTPLLRFISGKNYNEVGIENGHVSKGTETFLRRGNAPTQQSFLHCLSKILQKPDIEDEHTLKSLLLLNLSVQDFLFMQNGAVFRVFQAENMDSIVQDTHAFNAFKTWFIKQDKYIKQFHLAHVYKKVSKKKSLDTKDVEVMREFHIYNAYQNFMRYLENDSITKTHDFFTGLLSRGSKWLHALGFNLIVFEERNNRVYYSCPVGSQVDMASFQKPTVMLYRRQNYYEIIYHVKMIGSKVELTVFTEDDLHVMQMLYNLGLSCQTKAVKDIQDRDENNMQHKIKSILENEWHHKIRAFVMDYNLKHVGYLLAKDDVFVPLHTGFPLLSEQWTSHDKRTVFIDTMYNIVRPGENTKVAAKEILEGLNQRLGIKYYETSSHPAGGILKVSFPRFPENHVHYIMVDMEVKPTKQKDDLRDTMWYKDSLIFTRIQCSDPRKDLVDITRAIDNLHIALLNEIIHYVHSNAPLADEVELLRNALNPMPMLTKRRILFGLLDKHVRRKVVLLVDEDEKEMYKKLFLDSLCSTIQKENDCSAQCVWTEKRSKKNINAPGVQSCMLRVPKKLYMNLMARCLDNLLNPYFQLKHMPFIHNGKMQDNVLVFTPQEVEDGRLRNITSQNNNAFVSTLGYRPRIKDLEIEILDKNFFDRASVKKVVRGTQDTAQHLMIPYGFNAFLAEFTLVERHYKPHTLFEIFSTLYNVVHTIQHGSSKMSAENLRNVIVEKVYQNLLHDFDRTSDCLKEGLSLFKGTSAQKYKEYMMEANGFPSEYEMAMMGEIVGINTILLVRKSKKTDQKNIKRLYANKSSDYYVIFVERKCQQDKCYRYDIVQKKDKIFFHKEKIPEKFMRYIPRKPFFVT